MGKKMEIQISRVADVLSFGSKITWVFAVLLAFVCVPVWAQEEAAQPAPAKEKPKELTEEQQANAAWEFRPYRVVVWFCSDGTPSIEANLGELEQDLLRRAELLDPSGWELQVERPSSTYRWTFLNSIEDPYALTEELPKLESLANADKLMIVKLFSDQGRFHCTTRELDIRTQQWGPLLDGSADRIDEFGSAIMKSAARAFMPIARIDRVTDADEVFLRVRAMQACLRATRNEDGSWGVEEITDSPVWIQPDDRYLPVIRRTDRQGNLVRLEPVEYTYLMIEEQEGPQSVCSIQSYHRAPLHGRKSKRAQKLALVIRPPDRNTILQLVARGDEKTPLEGYEIWSGFPGAKKGEFDLIGETDWKGEIEITPTDRGMRIIYIKHGNRALKKLPIIPGLHARMVSTVPDDETRLYAEGIISGLQNEILNLVAQRQVYEAEIDIALKDKRIEEARELLVRYQELTTPQDLRTDLADEEARLKSQTDDNRELEFITTMFNTLREILNSKVVLSRESELRQRLQNVTNAS